MLRFIARRLLLMVPLLLGVSFLTFAIINLIPGSPVTFILTQLMHNTNMLGLAVIGGFYLFCIICTWFWHKNQLAELQAENETPVENN